MPGIKLVNAYGLTETSDDTNHEVMRSAPEGRSVPLGPAVQNVRVYVVDEQLRPVPLGAPGAIVFSGVCVGRGYINDPDRTAAAYLTDPHRPGERLYLAGDFGRWRPDGKLEFLGRRDSQVKISGFRIEIGEIENTLLRVPGVRDGAVVVAEPARGEQAPGRVLRRRPAAPGRPAARPARRLAARLHGAHRVPLAGRAAVDRQQQDRQEGADRAGRRARRRRDEDVEPPATPTEQRLAQVWATVLGEPVEQVGRRDHFFDKGGTSLTAVKVVIALKREVSLKEITRLPVLADLAALIDGRAERQTGLLQVLAEPAPAAEAALVCFPYAGGNAVNFRPMADALRAAGSRCSPSSCPGTTSPPSGSRSRPIGEVVARVVAELDAELGQARADPRDALGPLRGYRARRGRRAGAARARGGRWRGCSWPPSCRATRPGAAPRPTPARARATPRSPRGLGADTGYTELGELDAQRAEHVGAAYRHDCVTAHRYFADLLDAAAAPLPVPVTVVVAADDPSTAEFAHRHHEWQLVAEHVDLELLPDGGHHFLRTRPAAAADVVHRAARLLPSR